MRIKIFFFLWLIILHACDFQSLDKEFSREFNPRIAEPTFVRVTDKTDQPGIVEAGEPHVIKAGSGSTIHLKRNILTQVQSLTVSAGSPRVDLFDSESTGKPIEIEVRDSVLLAGIAEVYPAPMAYSRLHNPYSFRFHTRLQGLHDDINSIAFDKSGNLWIGTSGAGVSRFDGHNFSHFSQDKGLGDNQVLAILEDSNGHIWFGTQWGGISRYDGRNINIYNVQQGLPDNHIRCIFEDSSGNIWFGTNSGAIVKYDGMKFWNYSIQDLSNRRINMIMEDHRGTIWLGTTGAGLWGLNGKSFVNFTTSEGLNSDVILSGVIDNEGLIWLGTEDRGIIRFDGEIFTSFTLFPDETVDVLSIIQDRRGDIWFGTRGHGLGRFDGEFFYNFREREGILSEHITSVLEDRWGNIWFGTYGQGLGRYHGNRFTHIGEREGIIDTYIRGFNEDNYSRIWAGSQQSGVYVFDKDQIIHYTREDGLFSNAIRSILHDSKGNIWIGGIGNGLSRFDGENFYHYNSDNGLTVNHIACMIEDDQGNIWMGTRTEGAVRFDGTNFTYFTTENGLSDNNIRKILQDPQGNYWFASRRGGLTKYNGTHFYHITESNTLGLSDIMDMVADDQGRIWMGLYGNGIIVYDGRNFIQFTEREGLVNDFVFSLLHDKSGGVWFGTRQGISRLLSENFDILTKQLYADDDPEYHIPSVIFKNYTQDEGFHGIGVGSRAMFEDRRGNIWIGANDKITVFTPKDDFPDHIPPRLALTEVGLYHEKVNWLELENIMDTTVILGNGVALRKFRFTEASSWYGIPQQLSLSHRNNFINFRFTGITTHFEEKLKFRFMLEGLDENWSMLTNRMDVNYGNLLPGKYIFRVKAVNSEGIWSEELTYPFQIKHPWWVRWWAFMAYIIVLISILIVLHKKRQNRKRMLEAEKEKELLMRQEIAIARQSAEFKQNFLANMSHEIRTPLTGILGMAEILSNTSLNENQRDYLNTLMLSGENLRETINMVLDYSKIEAGKLKIHDDSFSFQRILANAEKLFEGINKNGLSLDIICDPEIPEYIISDQRRLNQVINNLLSNAVKFTQKGKITLKASQVNRPFKKFDKNVIELKVEVIDSGIGINIENQRNLFQPFFQVDQSYARTFDGTGLGLAICKELITLMGGEIGVVSHEGRGSNFWFTFKAKMNNNAANMNEISQGKDNSEKKLRIMLAEDKIVVQKVVMLMLKSLGHDITLVQNGAEALERYIPGGFDIILMDIQMPVMDGITAARKLREKHNQIPPIIGLSANAFEGDREKYISLGLDEYITKPVRQEDFERILSKVGLV